MKISISLFVAFVCFKFTAANNDDENICSHLVDLIKMTDTTELVEKDLDIPREMPLIVPHYCHAGYSGHASSVLPFRLLHEIYSYGTPRLDRIVTLFFVSGGCTDAVTIVGPPSPSLSELIRKIENAPRQRGLGIFCSEKFAVERFWISGRTLFFDAPFDGSVKSFKTLDSAFVVRKLIGPRQPHYVEFRVSRIQFTHHLEFYLIATNGDYAHFTSDWVEGQLPADLLFFKGLQNLFNFSRDAEVYYVDPARIRAAPQTGIRRIRRSPGVHHV